MAETQSVRSESTFKMLIGPVLIAVVAVIFYVLAGRIDEPPGPEHLGAAFWPKMMLIFLLVSCGIKGAEILRARGKAGEEEEILPPVNAPKLAVMIAMVVAAVFFMEILGFPLTNFLFLLLFMRIAGLKKKSSLIMVSVLGTVFLIYLFVKVVYLPLPKGQWFFDDFTITLYRILHII
ncbi:MAG TPA: tripartite tricarboxylate transporter TctB family protein [Thermodesulfobacteriota bacterium]|nr:tripartite tricarboxylate transporter TctB family protein [Thermodesulfobacteriota bacterium]